MTGYKKVLIALAILSTSCLVLAAGSPENLGVSNKNANPGLSFPYSGGWLGADDAYSIPLAPGKSVWLFGDTFAADPSTSDRSKAKAMVRNSVGITHCVPSRECTIDYYWQDASAAKPHSFFDTGKEEEEWYWPLDGYLDRDALYISLLVVRNRPGAGPTDPFGFEIAGTRWAKVTNPMESPDKWKFSIKDMTGKEFWPGPSLLRDGKFLLLYTQVTEGEGKGFMTVFRLPLNRLDDPAKNFEYLAKDGKWHAGTPHGDAKHVIDQAISEMSVRYHPSIRKWVAISPGPEFPSKRIVARTSDSPIGPWSQPQDIHEFPEMKPGTPGYDKDTFCYATKEHTEFEDSNIVLTYTCNSNLLAKVIATMDLYRPQVVVLDLPK